ncbi:MAG: TlpA disulfide reductase family protein [Bacteroidetes bacterium]|nr:TlpA disulfide reductase family protein [Bacteroidota bacterium]
MNALIIASCVFVVTGLLGILWIIRKNPNPIPRGPFQWMASLMCVLLIALSGLMIGLLTLPQESDYLSTDFSQIEPFEFQLVSSKESRNITDFQGQVILLNFWATWCAPCITELPELDELQIAYGDEGLVVVTVSDESLDEILLYQDLLPQETVSGFVERENLPELIQTELATGRPITFVIDGEGMIRERVRGAGDFGFFESLVTPWLASLDIET